MNPFLADTVQQGAREWMTAAGTVGAVIVALLLPIVIPIVRGWFIKPRLGIVFRPGEPFVGQQRVSPGASAYKKIGRVQIHNEGRSTARACRVRLELISEATPQANMSPVTDLDPIGLPWQRLQESQIDIAPHEWEWIRVWSWIRNQTEPSILGRADQDGSDIPIRTDEQRLRITVYADNAESFCRVFRVDRPSWDGVSMECLGDCE